MHTSTCTLKTHRIVSFEWVNCTLSEFILNKAAIKKERGRRKKKRRGRRRKELGRRGEGKGGGRRKIRKGREGRRERGNERIRSLQTFYQ